LDTASLVVPKIIKISQLSFKIYQGSLLHSTQHFRYCCVSEQHKLSKSEVVEKVIPVTDF